MVKLWMAVRIIRWSLIPIYAIYLIEFGINRPSHLDWRGLLLLSTEIMMFGIPTLFVVGLRANDSRSRHPRARDLPHRQLGRCCRPSRSKDKINRRRRDSSAATASCQ
jgi:hypothetical protein